MVAGDVVSEVGAVGAHLIFQPAAGVEVLVTTSMSTQVANPRLTDGILVSYPTNSSASTPISQVNIKVFINNTNYLYVYQGVGSANSFTGIQIK